MALAMEKLWRNCEDQDFAVNSLVRLGWKTVKLDMT
jgi:hypothetical protein